MRLFACRLVVPFLTLTPELCMVIEDDEDCFHSETITPDSESGEVGAKIVNESIINGTLGIL